MKKKRLSILMLGILLLSACDSNKGKVEELANQFVAAYNEGDKATIQEMFPAIKSFDNLSVSGTIGDAEEDIRVEKNDSTGNYIALINKMKKQSLEFAIDSLGDIKLIDTYKVFKLDSIANEVALKAGVPITQLSDLKLAGLLNADSDFIKDLKLTKNGANLMVNNGGYSWVRNASGINVLMNFTVSNYSSHTISGKDYFLFISPQQRSTRTAFASKTVDGVDIAPNEVREFNVSEPSLYKYASERDLSYNVEVKFRTESILSFILNYGTFKGNEYEDYLAHPFRAKVMSQGTFAVVNAEKKGVAYTYKEASEKSGVKDTLYHCMQVSYTWEKAGWAQVYSEDYQSLGFIQEKDLDVTNSIPVLALSKVTLISSDGKVKVYNNSDEALKDKVVKTYKAGQKVLAELGEWGNTIVYERQPDGSMKMIGRVDPENVDTENN